MSREKARTYREYSSTSVGHGQLYALSIIENVKVFYCPSQRYENFTYPTGWHHSPWGGYLVCGYYYRLFGQLTGGISQQDVDRLHHFSLHDLSQPIGLEADMFHPGEQGWGPYPEDTAWAHLEPPGTNVAFSDGHAEQISDNAFFAYAQVALPVYGGGDRFVKMAWNYLDGDPRELETNYFLPPELLE